MFKNLSSISTFALFFALGLTNGTPVAHARPTPDHPLRFTILHTNDLHSHFEGSGPDSYVLTQTPQGEKITGHYARLSQTIQNVRHDKQSLGPVLLLDSGDFFSGSLFHILGPNLRNTATPELDFFEYLQYDAVNFGNHEFDPSEKGLFNMLEKRRAYEHTPVPLVSSNLQLDPDTPLLRYYFNDTKSTSIHEKIIKDIPTSDGGTIRVGILGFMGSDATHGCQKSRVTAHYIGYDDDADSFHWRRYTKFIQSEVDSIRNNDKADIVIVLLHGGDPEDAKLAKAVGGIDVIIAGHTHEAYPAPHIVNQTVINQAGSFGDYLGVLNLSYDGKQVRFMNELQEPSVIPIDKNSPVDSNYLAKMDRYKTLIFKQLSKYGDFNYDTPIFTAQKDYFVKTELFNPLGQLVTGGIATQLNRIITHGQVKALDRVCQMPLAPAVDGVDHNPVSFYFTALALIRADIHGEIPTRYQFSDIFRILSIGYDSNLDPGYPVVTFYLTQKELYRMVSMFEISGKFITNAIPTYSPAVEFGVGWGIPLINRITDLNIGGVPYQECNPLIKVATNLFILKNLVTKIRSKSYGFLELEPKDWQGNPLPLVDQDFPREFILLSDYFRIHS